MNQLKTISNYLEIFSWVLGGLFLGLLILGIYNFYLEVNYPSTPNISADPIEPGEVQRQQQSNNFNPDELQIVEKLMPKPPEPPTENRNEENRRLPQKTDSISPESGGAEESDLPYELLGTTTGSEGYNSALVKNSRNGATRTLRSNEIWKNFQVTNIREGTIEIINRQTNQREKLSLNPKSKTPEKNPEANF